jgi:hypothetical protein
MPTQEPIASLSHHDRMKAIISIVVILFILAGGFFVYKHYHDLKVQADKQAYIDSLGNSTPPDFSFKESMVKNVNNTTTPSPLTDQQKLDIIKKLK